MPTTTVPEQTRLGTHPLAPSLQRSTAATENKRFGFGDREMLWY